LGEEPLMVFKFSCCTFDKSGDIMGVFPTMFSATRKQENPWAYDLAGLHIF
jgi:hypothetical protein